MLTKRHMKMSIRGFIKNNSFPSDYRDVFTDDKGNPLSPHDAREFLFDELSQGHEVIPVGECDNFDFKNGCQGHPRLKSIK